MQGKSVAKLLKYARIIIMPKQTFSESDLAAIAKRFREQSGKTRAQAARDMEVSQPSIFHAEESPGQALTKLRMRMIAAYSPFKVVGPVFHLEKRR